MVLGESGGEGLFFLMEMEFVDLLLLILVYYLLKINGINVFVMFDFVLLDVNVYF